MLVLSNYCNQPGYHNMQVGEAGNWTADLVISRLLLILLSNIPLCACQLEVQD